MHIDFRPPGAWSTLNDRVAQALNVDLDKTAVRNYQGVNHALIEVTQGLARLFPLKKKIHFVKNMNPLFEPALMLLAREGYQLNALDEKVLREPAEWAAALGREDLFILYSADEPLLGQAYDLQAFEQAATEKGIFKICLSHSRHFYELDRWRTTATPVGASSPLLLDKNLALIFALSPVWAIGVMGERGRLGPLIADQLWMEEFAWSSSQSLSTSFDKNFEWFRAPQASPQEKILDFEKRQVADAQPAFAEGALRVFDRAVIYWRDMDGHAVIDRLARSLKFELLPPGRETRLEAASLSRWGGVRTMDFYKNHGFSAEQLRGLIVINHELLDTVFEKALVEVRRSILADQGSPGAEA